MFLVDQHRSKRGLICFDLVDHALNWFTEGGWGKNQLGDFAKC